MSLFFKYASIKAATKIIDKRALGFCRPSYFNDPFDSLVPDVQGFENPEAVKQNAKEQTSLGTYIVKDKDYSIDFLNKQLNNTKDLAKIKRIEKCIRDLKKNGSISGIEKSFEVPDELAKNAVEEIKEIKNKYQNNIDTIFVCCGSEIDDSILMWTHYANGHEGVVLGFNKVNPLFKMKPVTYVEKREKRSEKLSVSHIIYNKAKMWEYEKELRLIFHPKLEKFKDKPKILCPYKEESLISICFGVYTKKPDRDKIIKKAKSLNKNIIFYEMQPDGSEYKLNKIKL